MGCSRAPTKDFIQLCKSPEKKKLIKVSILFYYRLSPNLTALETIQYRPPCAFRWLPSCPIHPPSLPRVFGWLLCLFIDWGQPKTTTNFVFLIFLPQIRWPKRLHGVLPYRHRPALRLSQVYSNDRAAFRLVVASLHPLEAIENRGPVALSVFVFTSLYSTPPNDGQTSSPTRSARSHRLSNVPPSADTIVRLVVTSPCQMAAIEGRCSTRLAVAKSSPYFSNQ